MAVQALPNLLIAAAVLAAFVYASRYVKRWVLSGTNRTSLNKSLDHLLASMAKTFVICVGFVLALSILELDKAVFSMLAGVGVIGLALGFAFQDLAANFISGLLLAVRAPIELGDEIAVNGIEGKVINVRLRDTIIRTYDGQDVFIPNKVFMAEKFTNFTSHGERRIQVVVGASYNDDLQKVRDTMMAAIGEIPQVLQTPAPRAIIKEMGDFAIPVVAQFWIKYPADNYMIIRTEAIIRIKRAMDEAGLSIPFPIRQLEFSNGLDNEMRAFSKAVSTSPDAVQS